MNKSIFTGTIVRDNDLKFAPGNGTAILRNTIAVKRKFKDPKSGKYESDFIPFISFGKTAEMIASYFEKGQGIQIEARMQSGSYEKDGKKVYTLEAVVESVEFMGGKDNKQGNKSNQESFDDMEPVDGDDIPF